MKTTSITHYILKVAVGLALSLTLAPAHGQIQTAGTLFVNVDATGLSAGNINAVPNSGTLGGFFEARGGGGTVPMIAFEGGTRGIRFDGNDYMQLVGAIGGPTTPAPAGLTGANPTRTVEVWALNPGFVWEETMVSWGKRGGPDGSNMAFGYGTHSSWGAVGHWGAPDIGWNNSGGAPAPRLWHHLVYTFDGTTTRVYSDGALANIEVVGAGAINTHPGTAINLATQLEANGVTPAAGFRGALTLGRVRVHDGVLSDPQILNNYNLERPAFVDPPPVTPEPLTAAPIHRYSFNQAGGPVFQDSIGSADGMVRGDGAQFNGSRLILPGGSQAVAAYGDLPNGLLSGQSTDNGGSGQISIEGWVRVTGNQSWSRIFDFGSRDIGGIGGEVFGPGGSGGAGRDYLFYGAQIGTDINTRRLELRNDDPCCGGVVIVDLATATFNSDLHFVVTWDEASGRIKAYENGEEIAAMAVSARMSDIHDVNVWLGRANFGFANHLNMQGEFDEFRIYAHVFSLSEVLGTFQSGPNAIDVADRTPPIISCPPAVTVQSSSQVPPPDFAGGSVSDDRDPSPSVTHEGDVLSIDCPPRRIARTYKATDASGNTAACIQTITIQDTGPVITLNGASSVHVEACTGTYTELGATAHDDCDGAVPVTIGGDTVSTAQPGTFVITYEATDAAGHITIAIRVVTVQDTQPPVFTSAPADLTVACGSGEQAAIDSWLASAAATDSCSPPVTITHALQWLDACAARHALVTWTATDARGRSRSTSANLTVEPDGMLNSLQFVDDDASLTMPRDTTQQVNVTVRNSGACPLVIQSAQIAATFTTPTLSVVSTFPVTVCAGANATVALQVNSTGALDGSYPATLTLQGPVGGTISLPVRITVSGRLWPDVSLEFTGGGVSVVPASSPVFPVVGEAFTIHASVKNVGAMAAGPFTVKFFEGANLLGTQEVAGLGVTQSTTVSLNILDGFPEGFYLIRAEATSPEGGELRVDNNSSSALLQVGVPFTADAFIRVTASLTPACTVDSGTLSVHAEYVIVTEQAVLTHPVQGGRVDAIIQGTPHGVNGAHTDRDGNLSASIGLPPGGNYTLHVAVTDFTITGEEDFPIMVPAQPNCAQGGAPQQQGNASPHYPTPEIADLYVCSSDLMFFAADGVTPLVAPPQAGQTVYLCASVHYYTSGGLPLNAQPVHFKAKRQLSLAAEDIFIGTTLANFAGGGVTTVCVQWRVPEEGTFVVTVALAPTIVQLLDNDTTTRALVVGNPQPPSTVIHVTAEGAGCSPGYQWVSGRATYEQADAFIQPVVCGQVTVRAYDSNGVLLGTRVGPTTDSAGNFYFGPGIALPVGANRIVVEVTDGTLTGSTEFIIECAASQNVPAPSTPPAAQGDLYLFSEHIAFLAADCVGSRSRNPVPGETISVAADIHYYDNYGGMPLSAVPVDINVLIPVGGTLQPFHIASTTVDFPFGGGSSVICSPWTPTVLGPQIIQVVIDAESASLPFVDYDGNNFATRLIFVGLQDLTLTSDPDVQHVLAGQSANYTIHGTVLSTDHPTLNLSAHFDGTTSPPGLGFSFGANTMTLPGSTTLTLSTTTTTPPGSYQLYVVGSGDQRSAVVRVTLIVESDTNAPTLMLLGDNPMTVECHSAFMDPGATAIDDTDGDLTANIIVSGSVDVNLPGTYTLSYAVTDAAGNAAQITRIVTVINTAPEITSFTGPSSPLAVGSSSSITVNFTDAEPTQGHRCRFAWDDGSPDTEVVQSAGTGSASASHVYPVAGVYTVTVTVTDDCGATATQMFQYVVIYDPSGGFVTGGGAIDSPAGAYPANPQLTGKANFGFVSKYKTGATIPTGETEFQFKAGDLNFHSSSYQWLVVSGPKAQYKGAGTINGAGSYKFLLTATDGQIAGGGGVDKFRIKITNGDITVYDNVPGASEDMENANPQAITGGSIVIHK